MKVMSPGKKLVGGIFVICLLLVSCSRSSDDSPSSTVVNANDETTLADPSATTSITDPLSLSSTTTTAGTSTSSDPTSVADPSDLATNDPGSSRETLPLELEPSQEPRGTEDLSPEMISEVRNLIGRTEQLRQLDFVDAPLITVLSPEELSERVRDEILEDQEDLPADEALYQLLGLIPDDADLGEIFLDLYGESVAGFYDGDTGELVVTSSDEEFSELQRLTMIHELTHALTDQHFSMHAQFDELVDADRFDEASAYLALIEGDAVWTEVQHVQNLPPDRIETIQGELVEVDRSVLDRTPRYLIESLEFPYNDGLGFVSDIFTSAGWEGINTAYSDPPISTEQVLHPSRYPSEEPVSVDLPDWTPPETYQLTYDSSWGEFSLRAWLTEFLTPGDAVVAAEGWGGDRYRLWFDGTEVVLVMVLVGDTEEESVELEEALEEYISAGISDEPEWAQVTRDGDRVLFVATADPDLVDQLSDLSL